MRNQEFYGQTDEPFNILKVYKHYLMVELMVNRLITNDFKIIHKSLISINSELPGCEKYLLFTPP